MPQKRHVRRARPNRGPQTARGIAFEVLSRHKQAGRFVAKLLDETVANGDRKSTV